MPYRILGTHPIKSTCAVVGAVIGSWTLGGVLSTLASVAAIVISSLQIYDWIQKRRGK